MHNDYPLAPEKLEISHNMLPNYCSSIANEYGIEIDGVNKLVPNLGDKSKYVLHYKNLKLYLSLGMKLTKVHKILKFKQSHKMFIRNFVAIHEIKPVLALDKPIYVGFSILDSSKLLMYELHHKYIKRKYNAKLLFTDTDSLIYEIKTDVYEIFMRKKFV